MKTLILLPSSFDSFFLEQLKKSAIDEIRIYPIYKKIGVLGRAIRKISIKYLKIRSIWYYDWDVDFQRIEKVIIFDSILSNEIIKDIKKKKADIKIYYWYWNPVLPNEKLNFDPLKRLEYMKKNTDGVWSFDENDCKKYNLNNNTQFYFNINKNFNKKLEGDIYFIGADKGRVKILKNIYNFSKKINKNIKFQILKDKNKIYEKNEENFIFLDKPIGYEKILEEIAKTKCILEICQDGQVGITLRTLESLFFEKKLITTNKNLKRYDFYNENNIFILDDNIEKLTNFLEIPFRKVSNSIKEKYTINEWAKRFK